jgi:50S ribosomal subunit-associated GTPase HflX
VPDAVGFTRRIRELHPTAAITSTMRTDGLTPLKLKLRDLERAGRVSVRVRVPLADGGRLAELYRDGEVLSREVNGESYELVVRLEPWRVQQLRAGGLEIVDLGAERARLRRASGSA